MFDQPDALRRVTLLRIITVSIALLMLLIGPYDTLYHKDAADIMYKGFFPSSYFGIVKLVTVIAGVLAFFNRVALVLFTMGYCLLNFVIHGYQEHYCMNQAHLNFILAALCCMRANDKEQASWILTFSGAFIVTLLFQTGLSKLIYGGVDWFTSGDTLYVETILDGTEFGRTMTAYKGVFPVFGVMVAIFELGFPWLFLWRRFHRFLGISMLCFHAGTFAVMGISFWFLWPLYFPTLIMGTRLQISLAANMSSTEKVQ